MAIGYGHMLLLKSDGTVQAWGSNGSGQLGTGNYTSSSVPVAVPGLTGVVDVVARGSFSMALKADGTVWVWGNNSDNLAGYVTSGGVFRNVPTKISDMKNMIGIAAAFDGLTAFTLDKNRAAWSWGSNSNGELGKGSGSNGVPAQIANTSDVTRISATNTQAVALRSNGTALAWGYNSSVDSMRVGGYKDGYAPASAVNVSAVSTLEAVPSNTAGLFMATDSQGRVLSWGDTNSGLLTCHQVSGSGTASLAQPYTITGLTGITQIAGGDTYALFLDDKGAVKGCGANGYGELGDGTTASTTQSSTPAKVGPVQTLGLPADVAFIAAGDDASGALGASGSVYTWGRASSGLSGVAGQTAASNTQATSLGINAGSFGNAPATYAGTQSGSIGKTTVDVGVAVAPSHVGATGEIYLVAIAAGGAIYVADGTGAWGAYDPQKPIAPYFKGGLPSRFPIPVVQDANFSGLEGLALIVGYGLGSDATANSDMLNNKRYGVVVTLQ
ncbi:MAG: hypothetical protein HY850_10340 [Betaproteobacteria bacterium]|nr:hypothetical protein [Betaproteobacteria bacterium]